MRFSRWVVFTFAMHLLVVALDKGSGFVLLLILSDEQALKGASDILNTLPFVMMAVANLGFATSSVYFLRRGEFEPQQVAGTTSLLAIVWGGGISLLAIVASQTVLPALKPSWSYDLGYVVPICLTVPFLLTTSYFNSIQLAVDRIRDYNFVHVAASAAFLPLFLVFYFVVGAPVIHSLAIARFTGAVLVTVLTLWMLRHVVRWRPKFDGRFFRNGLRFGWRANVTSTLTYLNHRIDLYLLPFLFLAGGALTGRDLAQAQLKELAIYSLAVTFAELVWHFPEGTRDLFFSKVAGSSPEQARVFTPTLSRLCLTVAVAGAIAIYLLVDPVLTVVMPDDDWTRLWEARVMPALACLVPGTVAFTVAKILQNDLAARGHLNHCIVACILVLVTMVGLDVVLIPQHGAIGAAIASSVGYFVSSVYSLFAYRMTGGAGYAECLFPRRSDLEYARDLVDAIREKVLRPRT